MNKVLRSHGRIMKITIQNINKHNIICENKMPKKSAAKVKNTTTVHDKPLPLIGIALYGMQLKRRRVGN